MNISDCIEQGLLKKALPDREKAAASLKMAMHKLDLAEKELASDIYENAIVSAYSSMFHSARSLLFRDGYTERSHFAVYVYLEEKYASKLERKYLTEFNTLRMERHEIMYGLEKSEMSQQNESKRAIATAKEFLSAISKL